MCALATLAAQAAETGPVNRFGYVATVFLTVFLDKWVKASDDRVQRVRLLNGILKTVETEEQIDASWWTAKKVETKLKKMAILCNRARNRAAAAAADSVAAGAPVPRAPQS